MIRHRFAYSAPAELSEAVDLLAATGEDTTIVGGGTWVVPELHNGRRSPRHLLDLRRLELDECMRDGAETVVGAATTYSAIEAAADAPALLRAMAAGITGGAQIRNQGTIGGSACYANPASDVPGVLVALDATLRLRSSGGARDIAAAEFFTGPYATALRPDELLEHVRVPEAASALSHGYVKLKLVAGSWPIVTAAALVGHRGAITMLVVGAAAACPVRIAVDAEADAVEIERAASAAIDEPWADALADGEYRRAVAGVIAKRAVAAARASQGERRG